MKRIAVTFIALFIAINSALAAEDQTEMSFDGGSVLIYCAAPSAADQIRSEVFLKAFPEWITNLQIHANEGRVARAHFLGELKEGIFIVVIGETKEQAREHALTIEAENTEILKKAATDAGVALDSEILDSDCDTIEIGPVAILPQ